MITKKRHAASTLNQLFCSEWTQRFSAIRGRRVTPRRKTLLLAIILLAVCAFGFHSIQPGYHVLALPLSQDQDNPGGPPASIAFTSNRDFNNEIYVMNPDNSDQTRLTFDSRSDRRPDISPNGHQIVFSSNRITPDNPEGDFEIFVENSDGNDVRQLTFNKAVDPTKAEDSWPRWSPNGQWIAFYSNANDESDYEIYLIRPDGTDLTRVTYHAGLDQYPEWSPNGKQLAIRRDLDIYLIDVDGSNPIQLTSATAPAFNQMASWSPDGKQIAFLSTSAGYASVFVMDTDGMNQVNLTPKPVGASPWSSRAPGWSRNGQHIYFTGLRPEAGANEQIFVMNADDGGDVKQLTFVGTNSESAVR